METPALNKPTSICCTPENHETPAQSSSSGKPPMSATLRERLKKARRSCNATLTVAKRLKINEDCGVLEEKVPSKEEPCSTSQDESICLEKSSDETLCLKNALQEKVFNGPEYTECNNTIQNSPQVALLGKDCEHRELLEEKAKLVKQIQEKQELLRRLKLVKMYRSKNNPEELQSLIAKWRSSSQAMLYELQSVLSTDGKKLSLTHLIDNFGLDEKLLHYIRTEESFMYV